MNIASRQNTPSFQSKIKFISSKEFDKLMFRDYFYCSRPENPVEFSMGRGKRLWTWEVRTCTSGGVVDNEGVTGFHLYDCKENVDNAETSLIPAMKVFGTKKPISALILGSKNFGKNQFSIPIFETVSRKIKEFVTPSEFKTYSRRYGETDLGYDHATDTWYINSSYPENPMMPVKDLEVKNLTDLKAMFKSIKIAPQDSLFIGEKEVSRTEHPELFLDA